MRILKEENNDFDIGVKIEHEHASTLEKIKNFYKQYDKFPDIEIVATWIVTDHLNEFPNYYNDKTGLPELERQLKREEKNG